jgi:hypothetical protein
MQLSRLVSFLGSLRQQELETLAQFSESPQQIPCNAKQPLSHSSVQTDHSWPSHDKHSAASHATPYGSPESAPEYKSTSSNSGVIVPGQDTYEHGLWALPSPKATSVCQLHAPTSQQTAASAGQGGKPHVQEAVSGGGGGGGAPLRAPLMGNGDFQSLQPPLKGSAVGRAYAEVHLCESSWKSTAEVPQEAEKKWLRSPETSKEVQTAAAEADSAFLPSDVPLSAQTVSSASSSARALTGPWEDSTGLLCPTLGHSEFAAGQAIEEQWIPGAEVTEQEGADRAPGPGEQAAWAAAGAATEGSASFRKGAPGKDKKGATGEEVEVRGPERDGRRGAACSEAAPHMSEASLSPDATLASSLTRLTSGLGVSKGTWPQDVAVAISEPLPAQGESLTDPWALPVAQATARPGKGAQGLQPVPPPQSLCEQPHPSDNYPSSAVTPPPRLFSGDSTKAPPPDATPLHTTNQDKHKAAPHHVNSSPSSSSAMTSLLMQNEIQEAMHSTVGHTSNGTASDQSGRFPSLATPCLNVSEPSDPFEASSAAWATQSHDAPEALEASMPSALPLNHLEASMPTALPLNHLEASMPTALPLNHLEASMPPALPLTHPAPSQQCELLQQSNVREVLEGSDPPAPPLTPPPRAQPSSRDPTSNLSDVGTVTLPVHAPPHSLDVNNHDIPGVLELSISQTLQPPVEDLNTAAGPSLKPTLPTLPAIVPAADGPQDTTATATHGSQKVPKGTKPSMEMEAASSAALSSASKRNASSAVVPTAAVLYMSGGLEQSASQSIPAASSSVPRINGFEETASSKYIPPNLPDTVAGAMQGLSGNITPKRQQRPQRSQRRHRNRPKSEPAPLWRALHSELQVAREAERAPMQLADTAPTLLGANNSLPVKGWKPEIVDHPYQQLTHALEAAQASHRESAAGGRAAPMEVEGSTTPAASRGSSGQAVTGQPISTEGRRPSGGKRPAQELELLGLPGALAGRPPEGALEKRNAKATGAQLVLATLQEHFDLLEWTIMQPLGFDDGRPVVAMLIFR